MVVVCVEMLVTKSSRDYETHNNHELRLLVGVMVYLLYLVESHLLSEKAKKS